MVIVLGSIAQNNFPFAKPVYDYCKMMINYAYEEVSTLLYMDDQASYYLGHGGIKYDANGNPSWIPTGEWKLAYGALGNGAMGYYRVFQSLVEINPGQPEVSLKKLMDYFADSANLFGMIADQMKKVNDQVDEMWRDNFGYDLDVNDFLHVPDVKLMMDSKENIKIANRLFTTMHKFSVNMAIAGQESVPLPYHHF